MRGLSEGFHSPVCRLSPVLVVDHSNSRSDSLLRHSRRHSKAYDVEKAQQKAPKPLPLSEFSFVDPLPASPSREDQSPPRSQNDFPDGTNVTPSTMGESLMCPNMVQRRQSSISHLGESPSVPVTEMGSGMNPLYSLNPSPDWQLGNTHLDRAMLNSSLLIPIPNEDNERPNLPELPSHQTVREHWFSNQRPLQNEVQDAAKDSETEGCIFLDHNRRIHLQNTLCQRPSEHALPSAEFLVCSIRAR